VAVQQKIRIKLKSYDHSLVDKWALRIIDVVKQTDAIIFGPIPLPTKAHVYPVNGSPHVHKKSREHFSFSSHKRLIEIINPTARTIDMLMKLELPSGVDVEIKS